MDSGNSVEEVDPEADTKEEEPPVSVQDAGRHIIAVDPEADTKVADTDKAGRDNEKSAKRKDSFSRNVPVKLGVPSSGLEKDNSVADTSVVVEEDPEADTKETCVRQLGTDVHRVVFSYSPHTPKRLKYFYPTDKVIGDGAMVFGRLAPLGGVQVKLNDKTISKRQFSLTLVHESDQWYFVFKNMSESKTVLLNGETLGLDENRRLPLVSRMRILDLDPAYGAGQSMDFLLCVETSNRSRSYKFEVIFKSDPNFAANFAMNSPAPLHQLNVPQPVPVQCSPSPDVSPRAARRCLDDDAFK